VSRGFAIDTIRLPDHIRTSLMDDLADPETELAKAVIGSVKSAQGSG
jgi:hypothetical protein